ncbi:MAG: hypothetical protein PHU12_02550 [Candidatus Aenigmarchaeota archaeon]|nr:hypothetical protein [Candidatus Aenigmarchaeota archaeon]
MSNNKNKYNGARLTVYLLGVGAIVQEKKAVDIRNWRDIAEQ